MQVLTIDSAMNGCQVCVCEVSEDAAREQCILAQEKQETTKGQAEQLVPMIERVIAKSGASYNSLDLIGVTNGPGAFTGMRIAIATARAIAMAADKPVVGVSTIDAVLDSVRMNSTPEEDIYPYCAVVLETKRRDFYFQMFEVDKRKDKIFHTTEAIVADASEISSIISTKDVLLVGDAVERLKCECEQNWSSCSVMIPQGASIARLAVLNYLDNEWDGCCKPVYLRGAEIGKAKSVPRAIRI